MANQESKFMRERRGAEAQGIVQSDSQKCFERGGDTKDLEDKEMNLQADFQFHIKVYLLGFFFFSFLKVCL